MYKKNKNKKVLLIFILILFSVLLCIFLNRKSNFTYVEKITHDIGSYIESIFIPKKIVVEDNVLDGINKELEDELNTLKINLNLEENNYHFIHASVIKREDDWYHELVINKGEDDGIKADMAVISNKGLIGKIVKTTFNTSYVKLLSSNSNNMKVSVSIKSKEDYYGIIDSYLKDENLIIVSNVNKSSNIEINDKVYTSGLGGIYPSGILIGEVIDITYDDLGIEKKLKVKPSSSFENISYVTVIDRS